MLAGSYVARDILDIILNFEDIIPYGCAHGTLVYTLKSSFLLLAIEVFLKNEM